MTAKKKKKERPWDSSLTTPEMLNLHGTAIAAHHIVKAVSVNAKGILGVRLSVDSHLDIPYVCVRSIGPSRVPMDFGGQGGASAPEARIVRQSSMAVLHKGKVDGCTETDWSNISAAIGVGELSKPAVLGDGLSMRLRQIILPIGDDGKDIAATPLPSPGLSALIRQRVDAEREVSMSQYRRYADYPIGGSNPQNVGIHIRPMQQPLSFMSPNLSRADLRHALSVYARGIKIYAPTKLLVWLYDQLKKNRAANGGVLLRDSSLRAIEASFVKSVVSGILQRASDATACLELHAEELKRMGFADFDRDGVHLSKDADALSQGLINPVLRNAEWRLRLANRIRDDIIGRVFTVGNKKTSLDLHRDDTGQWVSMIQEALL